MKIKPEELYLSHTEKTTLTMLSEGKSYFLIRKHFNIVSSNFPNILAALRRRTGILETKNPASATAYLERCRKAFESPEMTAEQEDIFRKVASGSTLQGISHQLRRPESEIRELHDEALGRAGIFSRHLPTIRVQSRLYLAAQELRPGTFAPLDIEIAIMRAVANGSSFKEAAAANRISENYAKECYRKGCTRAQVVSRGRNHQVKLVRAFLSALDARKAKEDVSMDDPAF